MAEIYSTALENSKHHTLHLLSSINSSVPIVINLESCAKFIWSYLNSDNHIVKTIAKSAKCSSVSNFEIIIDISIISIK